MHSTLQPPTHLALPQSTSPLHVQQKTRIGCSVQGPRKRESHTFATLHAASFDRSAPLQVHLPLSARGIVEHALGE